jgi:hypothetical protein
MGVEFISEAQDNFRAPESKFLPKQDQIKEYLQNGN